MEPVQNIIVSDTLKSIGEQQFADYLSHVYCHRGSCTFSYHNRKCRLEAGSCMIIPSRGDLMADLTATDDFMVDVILITQEFIQVATPQSNYGMRGHLSLFDNPVMLLNEEQQQRCKDNFAEIHRRLAQPQHNFYREIMVNAVQTMILDFFDFHAALYGEDRITSQYHQLMEQFIAMLERGDFRRNREIGYYADHLCVTAKYLSEVSKKVSGLPANYWITRYTALEISRLLRDRTLSFTDISDRFGFSSLSHFTRYVQNYLGAKPSDFRE